ncbi:sigma-70 family RNA polymerase sigma factor [Alcanivorax sp. S6407]|uniref:RNA polymerase sigma factor n=1 Tax=Alcanivorax sp. S6407 TaxID=2926424 RepID=UPI001FF5C933|nr:sigma-70 family RNA polymerase sigma factor [Alcanivorax sp. S6407]MCK0154921.1 sigma-70 family RNA polymerase sigma factor [Alcanivorax sp. S6407]
MSSTGVDWPSVIFDPAFMSGLDRMAAKRFVQPVLAEEATTAMLEALGENDWQRLASFGGKSSPATFAYAVAGRAMEDFARRRFGRPRPPRWLQELGQGWVRVWQMLCLERQWTEVIQTRLAADFQDGLLVEAIRTIKQRIPRCGEPGFSECCTTELGLEQLPDDQGETLDDTLHQAQHLHAQELLGQLLSANEAEAQLRPSEDSEAELTTMLENIEVSLDLSEEDKLLLSLSYEDGLSSRKVAELVELSPATVQRRLQDIRARLRASLQGIGLENTDGEVAYGE